MASDAPRAAPRLLYGVADAILFSIVVPTYNRGHVIGRTLQSLLAQTESSFEVIVVDDGSTDDTKAIVLQFADRRIRYHRQTNAERAAARNCGTSHARGAYLNYFDSDDLAHPNHLAEARALILSRDQPPMFHLRYDTRTPEGKVLHTSRALAMPMTGQIAADTLLQGNALLTAGVFLRRDVALAHPFEEDRKLAGTEDWVQWLRLIARFPMFENETPTSSLIQHEGRSVVVATLDELEARTRLTRQCLERDAAFIQQFGIRGLNRVDAHMHTYTALHAAMGGYGLAPVWRHLSMAARMCPSELIRHRTVAVLKHLILRRTAAG